MPYKTARKVPELHWKGEPCCHGLRDYAKVPGLTLFLTPDTDYGSGYQFEAISDVGVLVERRSWSGTSPTCRRYAEGWAAAYLRKKEKEAGDA